MASVSIPNPFQLRNREHFSQSVSDGSHDLPNGKSDDSLLGIFAKWQKVKGQDVMNERLPEPRLRQRLTELSADRHQELAKVLATCGWPAQELAELVNKNFTWVYRQMVYGRYLLNLPDGKNISEGTFRRFWDQTDKTADDEPRMAEVSRLIEQTNLEVRPPRALADKLMAHYADSKWHALDAMAAKLDTSPESVKTSLRSLGRLYNAKVKDKLVGLRPHYQIFRADKLILFSELKEKFGPLITQLKQQGRTNAATVSIGTVSYCAQKLEQILDELGQ